MGVEQAQGGQAADEVEKMAAHALQGQKLFGLALTRAPPDEHHEDRDQWRGQQQDERRDPTRRQQGGDDHQRRENGKPSLRAIACEIAVECFYLLQQRRTQGAGLTAFTPGGAEAVQGVEQRFTHGSSHRKRDANAGFLAHGAGQSANHDARRNHPPIVLYVIEGPAHDDQRVQHVRQQAGEDDGGRRLQRAGDHDQPGPAGMTAEASANLA